MKKLNIFKKSLGKRNLTLSLVALILILLTTVSISYSWIEEVSNVELKSNDGTKTPLHISGRKLKSDISVQKEGSVVDLSDFFAESGDMHLSACYSDGTNFMFPQSGTSETAFRKGTKSDANTNYISMTFRVTSNGAPTAYWFEYKNKSNTNPFIAAKDYTGETNAAGEKTTADHSPTAALKGYLRASITVNGATTVYGFNDNGQFKYLDGSSIKTATGSDNTPSPRPVEKYMYYNEQETNTSDPVSNGKGLWVSNSTNRGYANQGGYDGVKDSTRNLNGNTLFTVGKDKTETVTVKLWLEAGAPVTSIDASDINLQLTSSWVKTRRIYVRDETQDEWDFGNGGKDDGFARGSAHWLNGGTNKLYWAINDSDTPADRTHFEMIKMSGLNVYYVDIPAVYNGYSTTLYRCETTWNTGNTHSGDIQYWDNWGTTAFPNTYHGEAYSVYSHEYGTWETSGTSYVGFVNSGGFGDPTTYNSNQKSIWPRSYLWQSNTNLSANKNVVENAPWPGAQMTPMNDTTEGVNDKNKFRLFRFYYSSSFDWGVFNDGKGTATGAQGYQTQDLALLDGNQSWANKIFDMATLDWYDKKSDLPTYTNNYFYSNIGQNGDNDWCDINFTYKNNGTGIFNGTNGNNEVCRVYVKSDQTWSSYQFKVRVRDNNGNYTYYGLNGGNYIDAGGASSQGHNDFVLKSGEANVTIKFPTPHKIYPIYLKWNNGTPQIYAGAAMDH